MSPLNSVRALVLVAAAAHASAFGQAKITLGYTGTSDFAAVFVAKEQGIFDKHKVDVTLQQLPLTSNVPPALVSDSIQIGGTTAPVFLQAVDSGLDLVTVSTGGVFNNANGPVAVIGRSGANIRSASDLADKKLGVPGLGGALHVLVRRWLADKHVDSKRVTFVEVSVPQMPGVLQGGSVDAVVVPEPFVSRIVHSKIGEVVPGFASDMPNGFATISFVATRQWATANADTAKRFRAALAEAVTFANANQAQAYADLGKYFKVPEPVLKATPWPTLVSSAEDSHLRFWIETMRAQGMLSKSIVPSSVIVK